MFWEYSRKESKVLLTVTLLLFATGALLFAQYWHAMTQKESLTANSVGVFAGVEKNEINTLATQLSQKEKALEEREQALLYAEGTVTEKRTLFAIAIIGVSLLGLILLNFYLDTKKRHSLA